MSSEHLFTETDSGVPRSGRAPAGVGGPIVVALIGLPGAGKSVVARALEDQLGLRRICRDAIRHAMFPKCSYSFAEKRAAFRSLLLALEINCMLGESSVLDGVTFSRRRDLLRVDGVIRRYGFAPVPIYLDCPPDVARARIAEDVRNNQHLARDRTPAMVTDVLMRFDTPPPSAIVIDATLPPVEVCRLAAAAVAAVRASGSVIEAVDKKAIGEHG
jgi:predicted kinase